MYYPDCKISSQITYFPLDNRKLHEAVLFKLLTCENKMSVPELV